MDAPTDDRRLVSRVVRHWHDAALGQRFPSRAQIDPGLVGEDWASCAVIELAPQVDHSTFIVVGPSLLPPGHEPLDGKPITACPHNALLDVLVKYLPRFQPNGRPLSISGSVTHSVGPILFRAVLLPLSSDGGAHIDSVLGAANFRELREGEDKHLRTRLQVATLNMDKEQLFGRRSLRRLWQATRQLYRPRPTARQRGSHRR